MFTSYSFTFYFAVLEGLFVEYEIVDMGCMHDEKLHTFTEDLLSGLVLA